MTPSIFSQTDLRQMSASLEMTMNQSREISQQMKEGLVGNNMTGIRRKSGAEKFVWGDARKDWTIL
jgi:hypothetical protein